MRNAVKVVVFLCALLILSTQTARGLSSQDLALTDDPFYRQAKLTAQQKQAEVEAKAEAEEEERTKEAEEKAIQEALAQTAPVTHAVSSGENLTKIAEQYGTTWRRLFDKNVQIADPNTLLIGEVITIPAADEQLTERAFVEPEVVPVVTSVQPRPRAGTTSTAARVPRNSSTGNTYAPGYCTWYAKSRRPDLPNRLGNASAWVASAAAHGFATGSTPQAGAIGQQGNHVVYVESVNGDGTVTVSEMNYKGLFIISSRTVSASAFRYIY